MTTLLKLLTKRNETYIHVLLVMYIIDKKIQLNFIQCNIINKESQEYKKKANNFYGIRHTCNKNVSYHFVS